MLIIKSLIIGLTVITDFLTNIGVMEEPEPLPDIQFIAYEKSLSEYEDIELSFLPTIEEIDGVTYVNGILFVDNDIGLPEDYNPGLQDEVIEAYEEMFEDAEELDLNFVITSEFRTYETQSELWDSGVELHGSEEEAERWVGRPGYSEHQTGLAIDVGSHESWILQEVGFEWTPESDWLKDNAHKYGFIVRYPEGFEDVTGMAYEPWHLRYLGEEIATEIYESGLTLEHYLNLASESE